MKRSLLVLGLSVSLILAVGACGKKQDAGTSAPPAVTAAASPAESPQDLANAIGQIYSDTLSKVADSLKDRPEPAPAKSHLADLKEAAIKELVVLGRKREALSPADRQTLDSSLQTKLSLFPSDLFAAYQQAHQYYSSKDNDVANGKMEA